MNISIIIAAVDGGADSGRIVYHAIIIGRLLGARVRILQAGDDPSDAARQRLYETLARAVPYAIDISEAEIVMRSGQAAAAIIAEAGRSTLIVMGSHGRGALARLLVGSTSDAVLRANITPVLLIPPTEMDIVSWVGAAALTSGSLLMAIDLSAPPSPRQAEIAGALAHLARQPLLLLTVRDAQVSDRDASEQLRERAHDMPVKPTALIVRHGDVAEEIARCAVAEGAGLVVMGLATSGGQRPGAIAAAVIKTGRAFVVAVPGDVTRAS